MDYCADAWVKAWRTWSPVTGVPFHAYATQPPLRPLTHRELAAREEARDWLPAELARHQECFTPQAWHTLDETLSELPSADIAVRDGIPVQHARQR